MKCETKANNVTSGTDRWLDCFLNKPKLESICSIADKTSEIILLAMNYIRELIRILYRECDAFYCIFVNFCPKKSRREKNEHTLKSFSSSDLSLAVCSLVCSIVRTFAGLFFVLSPFFLSFVVCTLLFRSRSWRHIFFWLANRGFVLYYTTANGLTPNGGDKRCESETECAIERRCSGVHYHKCIVKPNQIRSM